MMRKLGFFPLDEVILGSLGLCVMGMRKYLLTGNILEGEQEIQLFMSHKSDDTT